MKTITLKRVSTSGPDGVFGVLIADNIPFAVTLERPWRAFKKERRIWPYLPSAAPAWPPQGYWPGWGQL